ncbi:Pre-mRNA-splicing factor slt11 [Puttea exsequens]|nr:Pre-mRNA-splicing factor slt11 [Puttea exsequens]
MVAPGPESSINREYYAQENEKEIEEGRGGVEEYEKTDEKARELLRRLANSEPYYKRQRRLEPSEENENAEGSQGGQKRLAAAPGPIRSQDSRSGRGRAFQGRGGARGGKVFPGTAQLPPQPHDIMPPRDPNVTSLFVTGVEDDLPEHALRTFFMPFGVLRSLVCSHRSHCAFINYAAREGAEAAAEHCQGKAVIQGCPLRVRWGKPKALDHLDIEERMRHAREGRDTAKALKSLNAPSTSANAIEHGVPVGYSRDDLASIAPPPGDHDVEYPSLAGN